MNAPFKIGLSDFFLKFLITFAGAFPVSENINEVFPLRIFVNSPKSWSEASIALANNVFFTTCNFMFSLKQACRKLLVCIASRPAMSAK